MKRNQPFCNYLLALLALIFVQDALSQDIGLWQQLAPGAGGQVQDIYFDPNVKDRIWISSDVEGSYYSNDLGENWTFVGKELSHAMSFLVRTDVGVNRIYQGGLWGAHYSDDLGKTWELIRPTRATAIAAIAVSKDADKVVLAKGWNTKDPQKGQAALLDPLQPLLGKRSVYISNGNVDNGVPSFVETQYETADGYNQVWEVFIHPVTNDIYLGTAAGIYWYDFSADANKNDDTYQWQRIDNPESAFLGKRSGIQTLTYIKPNGTVDINRYKDSGGCSGMGFSPDGSRIYAVFQTNTDRNALPQWSIFTTTTTALTSGNPNWTVLPGLQNVPLRTISPDLPDSSFVPWYNPKVDPWATATEQKLLLGTLFLGKNSRVGLVEGTITFNANGSINDQWVNIVNNKLSLQGPGGPGAPLGQMDRAIDLGWEDPQFLSRAYDYTPITWDTNNNGNNRKIISAGGNNYYLSNNENVAGWPFVLDSWLPIYTIKKTDENVGPQPTYSGTGFANTVTYDIDTYEDYAIQGNADQGALESWDGGVSWTKKTTPNDLKNCQSVVITKTVPPIVMAEGRPDFGIPKFFKQTLWARKLVNPGKQPALSDWKVIGGGTDKFRLKNGLNNRLMQAVALDDKNVSRVYAGFRQDGGDGGIYATEAIEAVFDGKEQWVEISDASMRPEPAFRDIFVDPNDSNILWAAGSSLYRGVRSAPYEWEWKRLNIAVNDLYVWDVNGKTAVAIAAKVDGGAPEVYLLSNPESDDWNNTANLKSTGMDIPFSLGLREEPWVEQPGETIDFRSLAGYKNQIYVGTENGRHKKGLGIFKGRVSVAANGDLKVDKNTWEDFMDDGTRELYYARTGNGDAKIKIETDGTVNYYLPTFGNGVWRRQIARDNSVPDITLSTGALIFASNANSTQELTITTAGGNATWSVRNVPNWLAVNGNNTGANYNGSGTETITFTASENEGNLFRQAEINVIKSGKTFPVLVKQLPKNVSVAFVGTPITIDGNSDAAWNALDTNAIDSEVFGNSSGKNDAFQVAYNQEFLYVKATIDDASVNDKDAIFVGIDIDNNKRDGSLGINDYIFKISKNGSFEGVRNKANPIALNTGVRRNSNRYIYEIALAWDDIGAQPVNGQEIGIEVGLEDFNTNGTISRRTQFVGTEALNASTPESWGTGELDGPQLPWFENFNLPEGATVDNGATAWSIDPNGLDAEPKSFFEVNDKNALIAKNTREEVVFRTEAIAVPADQDVSISIDVKEKGTNFDPNRPDKTGRLEVFAKYDGNLPLVKIGEIIGDSATDDEFITFTETVNGVSSIELIVKIFNKDAGKVHTVDNIVVSFGAVQSNCKKPVNLAVLSVGTIGAKLSWRNPVGDGLLYDIQVREKGANSWKTALQERAFRRGTEIFEFSLSKFTDGSERLTPDTEHEWRIRQRCADGSTTPFTVGKNFTTQAPSVPRLYRETFASPFDTSPSTIAAYTAYDGLRNTEASISYEGSGQIRFRDEPARYNGASNSMQLLLNGANGTKNLIVKGINSTSFSETSFQFGVLELRKDGGSQGLVVEYRNGNSGSWTRIPFTVEDNDNTSDWSFVNKEQFFPRTANLQLRFTASAGSSYRVDDIGITGIEIVLEGCQPATNLRTIDIAQNQATLAWDAGANAITYEVRIRPNGTTDWEVLPSNGNSQVVTDLTAGTAYQWQVRSLCADNETSDWTTQTPAQFTTEDDDPGTPGGTLFLETHDSSSSCSGNSNLANYSCYTGDGDHAGSGSAAKNSLQGTYEGASNERHVFLDNANENYSITNIDASGPDNISISFGVLQQKARADGSALRVEVTANGTDWTVLTLPDLSQDSRAWQLVNLTNLPAAVQGSATFGIRFTALSTVKYRIDDIAVNGGEGNTNTCAAPGNVTIGSITASGATLSWNASADANAYQARIRPTGTTDWSVSNVNATQTVFGSLSAGTEYETQVRSVCGGGNNSDWVSQTPIVFSTQSGGSGNQDVVFFLETHDSSTDCRRNSNLELYTCYTGEADHSGSGSAARSSLTATYQNATNERHAFLDNANENYVITNIDASSYTDLSLSFGVLQETAGADGSGLRVEVSANGSNWIPLTLPNLAKDRREWQLLSFGQLPQAVQGSANLGIRFTALSGVRYRIDDIRFVGDEGNGVSAKATLGEELSGANYSVFPNPVKDRLHIDFSGGVMPTRIQVMDINGRIVLQEAAGLSNSTTLETSAWPTGLYFIRVQNGIQDHTFKILKQ